MTKDSFFNTAMLDKLAEQLDGVNAPAVSITKPVARAMVFELRRFYGEQSASDQERTALVQKLTFEYACQHISDLLRAISDQNPDDDIAAAMMFAVSEIMLLTKENDFQTKGTA